MTTDLVQALAAAGTRLTGWFVPVLITSSLILAAAWIADLALRRRVSARLRMLLFAAVLVRLALPADLATPIGLRTTGSAMNSSTVTVASATEMPSHAPMLEAPLGAHRVEAIRLTALIPIAWAVGTLAVLLTLVIGRIRLTRALRAVEPSRLIARAPVVFHDSIGPAVVGVLAPRIVLPRSLANSLDEASLADILGHESAHVERRDPWTFALVQVILALAWPVLPAWIAARRLRALAEEACDERAVAGRDGAGRRAYASTLITLAEGMKRPAPAASLGLLMTGPRVEARLAALRFTRRWPVALQVALVLGASLGALATLGAARATAGETTNALAPPRIEVATLTQAHDDVLQTMAWPLQHLTAEEAHALVVPLLSERGSEVVDRRTMTLFVSDAQDRLDAVRSMLERDDVAASNTTGQAMVTVIVADVSRAWVAAHRDLLPESCTGERRCEGVLDDETLSALALPEAIVAGEATKDARSVTRLIIAVQIGRPAAVTRGEQGVDGPDFNLDLLIVPDADGVMRVQHHLRWNSATVEVRGKVVVGVTGIVLVPFRGERDGRLALIAVEARPMEPEPAARRP